MFSSNRDFPSHIYPDALRDEELQQVNTRRQQAGIETKATANANVFVANGIGFSGGGIRSATFALGFSQALAKAQLWAKMDFMSTVSGGGYFGAFLGRLFQQQGSVKKTEQVLQNGLGVAHLRLFGRYLAPGGRDDAWAAAAQMLRNLFFLQALFFLLAVAGATIAILATHIGRDWSWVQAFTQFFPAVFIPAFALLLFALFASLFYFSLAINGGSFRRLAQVDQPANKLFYFVLRLLLTVSLLVLLFTPLAAVGTQSLPALQPLSESLLSLFAPALLVFIALAILLYYKPQNEVVVSSWRLRATRLLRWLLLAFFVGAVCAAIDFGSFEILQKIKALQASDIKPLIAKLLGALFGSNVLITIGQKLLQSFSARDGLSSQWKSALMTVLIALLASVILLVFLLIAFICAHAASIAITSAWSLRYWGLLIICVLTLLAVGSISAFANYTSMHSFYFSRLKRAWLRAATLDSQSTVLNDIHAIQQGDDVNIAEYSPQQCGGPIHFINCTINETIGKDTGMYQADRRGIQLAISSHLVTVGARHHLMAPWQQGFSYSNFQLFGDAATRGPDALTLGRWVAISGAAFSTGLGQMTRWYYALIAASLNVRLGFWWRSRSNLKADALNPRLPLQLLQESFGMFRGTCDPHWYLTDGGHFENMAGYELIRRRLARIVIVDAECDGDYQYGGMANLVHKARLDFDAEIRFLSDEEITQAFGGGLQSALASLNSLSENGVKGGKFMRAAIARVHYRDTPASNTAEKVLAKNAHWLLYVKPVVTGFESLDITQYKSDNPSFPQQTTIDQFFDERQWEAYRKLGEITGVELANLIAEFLVE